MTAPTRQKNLKSRKTLFILAFIPAFILSLAPLYFAATVIILPISSIYAAAKGIPASGVEGLPEAIYGSPPQVLSLKSFARLGTLLALIPLAHAGLKMRELRRGGGTRVAGLLSARRLSEPREARELELSRAVGQAAATAGLPRPPVYVLPKVWTINSAVVGWDGRSVVVVVSA